MRTKASASSLTALSSSPILSSRRSPQRCLRARMRCELRVTGAALRLMHRTHAICLLCAFGVRAVKGNETADALNALKPSKSIDGSGDELSGESGWAQAGVNGTANVAQWQQRF